MTITLRPHQERAVAAMGENTKGQVIIPTGGGKTICMIEDAKQRFENTDNSTIVVVAPRILLANQLCSEFLELIKDVCVIHVHSGETKHFSTTKPERIKLAVGMCDLAPTNRIIFTTYHSLHRVVESGIKVDTIYFDEAHNSVQRNFFAPTDHYSSMDGVRCFFFTATPKHSATIFKPGMNDAAVYGNVICNVSAPELVDGGYILAPKVVVKKLEMVQDKQHVAERDAENLI